MINEAIIFATNAHGNRMRKGSDTLYILHPLEAGIIVSQIKYDENLIAAAILYSLVNSLAI